jgi:hypothetical protein
MSADKYIARLPQDQQAYAQAYLRYLRGEQDAPQPSNYDVQHALQQICCGH